MTADVTRRTWSNPSAEVLAASQAAQREAKRLHAAEHLLAEAHKALTQPQTPQTAQLHARIGVFLAAT